MAISKTEAIVLRVEAELKNELQKLAELDSRKLSDYIRVQLKKLVEATKKK
jgi:hypothetical protein